VAANDYEQSQKYFKKGLGKQKERDFAAAEDFYKRALRHNPMHLDANYLLGTLYAEQRDLAKALKFLRQAEEINPRSHMIENNLNNIFINPLNKKAIVKVRLKICVNLCNLRILSPFFQDNSTPFIRLFI
jgi:tetratricopeptide (TPR) repeat protein